MSEEITKEQVLKKMREWIILNPNNFPTATSLAEAIISYYDKEEWYDDETHFVWDAAVEVYKFSDNFKNLVKNLNIKMKNLKNIKK